MTKEKEERHQLIKKLILSNKIASQDILLNLLIDSGFDITQATLSRDMRELGIVKIPSSGGGYAYQIAEEINQRSDRQLSNYGFLSLEFSGNLAVMKTRPGYAMGIAGEIDHRASPIILGTVAGDDTILLILKENTSKEVVTSMLSDFITSLK